jgi:hypothetical protein
MIKFDHNFKSRKEKAVYWIHSQIYINKYQVQIQNQIVLTLQVQYALKINSKQ